MDCNNWRRWSRGLWWSPKLVFELNIAGPHWAKEAMLPFGICGTVLGWLISWWMKSWMWLGGELFVVVLAACWVAMELAKEVFEYWNGLGGPWSPVSWLTLLSLTFGSRISGPPKALWCRLSRNWAWVRQTSKHTKKCTTVKILKELIRAGSYYNLPQLVLHQNRKSVGVINKPMNEGSNAARWWVIFGGVGGLLGSPGAC